MTGLEYIASVKALTRAQKVMLIVLAIAVALANIDQPYPELAPLQHIPTVILILVAPMLLRRWRLSNGSVAALWVFMLLHTLGGRYIYSYVPYDVWAKTVAGTSVSEAFGWTRNGYDRLVHLAFGLLWTIPVIQAVQSRNTVSAAPAAFVAFAFVGLVSALYEVFEWALTLFAAGDTADYYNGQQGDIWDAQKDMAIALFGSLVTLCWMGMRKR